MDPDVIIYREAIVRKEIRECLKRLSDPRFGIVHVEPDARRMRENPDMRGMLEAESWLPTLLQIEKRIKELTAEVEVESEPPPAEQSEASVQVPVRGRRQRPAPISAG